jgi:ACS family hexuronate transporter-like MFS transporter
VKSFAPEVRGLLAKKWRLCILLFLATVLNYLDRQTVSVLAPLMQKEMHLDNVALGLIFSAFYYAYMCSQFVVGFVLDRAHLRWVFGAAVLAWSLVSAATGLAGGFLALLVFRSLLGMMESANWPGAIRIVARAFPPHERALGNGIFTSGSSTGALVAPALILAITAVWGWRAAFVAIGSLGAVWFVLWVLFTGDREFAGVWQDRGEHSGAPRPGWLASLLPLFRSPRFVPVLVVSILVNPCLYFSVNWLPTYFSQQRHVPLGRQMGWILTAIYLGIDLGNIACGAGILALTRRGQSLQAARRAVFIAATAAVACCAAVPFIESLTLAVVALVAVNFGTGIWSTMSLTMSQEALPGNPSTSIGILSGCGSFAGGWSMAAVGKITQATGSFAIPMAMVATAAIVSACAGWLASREIKGRHAVACGME